jgi:hypothetical protein
MLKYKVDKEGLAALGEDMQKFYTEKDGEFVLQVEGATAKSKVDEFRTTNIELENKLKQFSSVDLEKYNALLETDKKMRNKELIEKGDIDTLLNESTEAIKSDYEARLANLTEQLTGQTTENQKMLSRYEIEGAAHKAFAEHKIQPDAQSAVMAQIKQMFSINDGKVLAKDGDNILTGANGNLSISEFVQGQPEFMKIASSGGHGKGSDLRSEVDKVAAKRSAYSQLVGKT